MRFLTIDIETANTRRASICQIGIVEYLDGINIKEYDILLNPEEEFKAFNSRIHGISAETVAGKPTFPQIADSLRSSFDGQIVAHHSTFDKSALTKAYEKYRLKPLNNVTWLDTVAVSKYVWPNLANHRLKTLAKHLKINFQHHNAIEDARTCGLILLAAINESESSLERLVNRYGDRQINRSPHNKQIYTITEKPKEQYKETNYGLLIAMIFVVILLSIIFLIK